MRASFLIAMLCLVPPTAASAKPIDARKLTIGTALKGLPSTKPIAEMYYLIGEAGAKETFTLTIKGPASISIFTPGGDEMVTASGAGVIKLEAVLPFTDLFMIAVARKDTRQSYTLSRKASTPTLAETVLAGEIGYEALEDATPSLGVGSCRA